MTDHETELYLEGNKAYQQGYDRGYQLGIKQPDPNIKAAYDRLKDILDYEEMLDNAVEYPCGASEMALVMFKAIKQHCEVNE